MVRAFLLLGWLVSAAQGSAETGDCPVGAAPGACARGVGLEAESDDSILGRLKALIWNERQPIGVYDNRFEGGNNASSDQQKDTTDEYYDLATDFYEYGWGTSFHFATRVEGESLPASITRHEHFLSAKMGLRPGHKVADLGMGVGGPLRSIVRFSGAHVTGITLNKYQVQRARKLTRQRESAAMSAKMNYVNADFTQLVPRVFEPESLDGVYYIESSCHLDNRTQPFAESARALKKGGKLFTYEWVMTDRYDPENATHREIKKGIEHGDGIANLVSYKEPLRALEASGFKILEHGDLNDIAEEWYGDKNIPWYEPLQAGWSIQQFPQSSAGRFVTRNLLWFTETVGLVAKGGQATATMLEDAAVYLVKGGEQKLFTPMYYILAEKI